jgi:iron complex transport system substrate-binding protein
MRRTLIAACLVLNFTPAMADAPRRVASFNQCGDQLVLALADPEQIAGLSPYAADPALSAVAEKAKAFLRLDWQAESTIALGPDLVLIGQNDRPVTKHILRAQGMRLYEIALVDDLETARRQITDVAAILGHPERGEKLLAEFDAARARLRAAAKTSFTTALLVNRGGYTAGERSLAAALLAEAGLKPPPGSPPGYGGYVPLERLLTLKPDIIVLNSMPTGAKDQGSYNLSHPALDALYPPQRRIILPPRYTICGGVALIEAFDYLAGLLSRLAQSPTMRTN